ncbi:MAG: tetratricopeptide repeat protein [Bacteroidales bacterium]|jgi:tetratricopeptide (TPR) repeat protein|nr:tetratricopeptide repeat protein [Bacteroidales bacterium]
MKKIVLSAIALALLGAGCITANAQEKTKEQLKAEAAAQKALKKEFDGYMKVAKKNSQSDPATGVKPNVPVALEAIKKAEAMSLSKDNAEFYLLAGQVETIAFQEAAQASDYPGYAAAAQAGFNYFSKAYDLSLNDKKLNKFIAPAQKGALDIYTQTSGLAMIGNVFYQTKEYDKCLAAFRTAKTAFNIPVIASQRSNQLTETVSIAQYAADSTINNLSLNCFSVAQYMLNDTTEAIKELIFLKDRVTDETTTNQVLQALALDYYALDDTVKFEATLKEGVKRLPSEPWYITNLINLYIGRNDLNAASEFLDKAIASDPNNADLIRTKGLLLEQQEKIEEALTFYEKALALDPSSATVNSAMGRYYYNRAQNIEDEYYNKKKFEEGDRQATVMYEKALPYYEAAFSFDSERKDKGIGIALRQLYGRRIAKVGKTSAEGKELTAKRQEVCAAYELEQ